MVLMHDGEATSLRVVLKPFNYDLGVDYYVYTTVFYQR